MNGSSEDSQKPDEFVIGTEMAVAREAEDRRLAQAGLGPSPLPSEHYDPWRGDHRLYVPERLPLDDAITAFVRGYRGLEPGARGDLRHSLSIDDAYTLLAYARRSAVFALRAGDSVLIEDGLGACSAIEVERVDGRDLLVALGLLHHAADRCGADPSVLFRDAASRAEPAVAELVEGFLRRPAAERDLRDAWGMLEVDGPRGSGLLQCGYRPWHPTLDVAAAAIRLSDALTGIDYVADDPELAVELPAYWLSTAGDSALEPTLRDAPATTVVHARMRPTVSPDHAAQQLTAWLLELGDEVGAARLESLSKTPPPGVALMGAARGRLFALVATRSYVDGVESVENVASLSRFEPAVRDVLASVAVNPGR